MRVPYEPPKIASLYEKLAGPRAELYDQLAAMLESSEEAVALAAALAPWLDRRLKAERDRGRAEIYKQFEAIKPAVPQPEPAPVPVETAPVRSIDNDGEQLHDLWEASRRLHVSRYTVARLIQRGVIHSVRVSKRVFVSESELSRVLRDGAPYPQNPQS